MPRLIALVVTAALLAGCATTDGLREAAGEDLVKVLDRLADNKLLDRAEESTNRTLAWVDAEQKAGRLSQLNAMSARQCPLAVQAAMVDLRQKITELKAIIGSGPGEGRITGYLIYDLTRAKYGQQGGIRDRFDVIREDINNRADAIVAGCFHLATEEAGELAKLLGQAGAFTIPGGGIAGRLILR